MSKAVTNEEVEDVLSSIRRLVSEDKRPLAGLRSTPPEPVVEQSNEPDAQSGDMSQSTVVEPPKDHFVLTPALRVAEPPASEPETAQNDDSHQENETQQGDDAPLDLASVARETWTDAEDDAESETAEDAGTDGNEPMMLFPQSGDDDADETARSDGDDPAMDAVDALVQDALETDASEATDTEAEGDYSDESYWDVEDDGQEHHGDYMEEADTSIDDVAEPVEIETSQEMDADDDSGDADNGEQARDDDAISILPLTAKIAALEAAVGGINHDWEPDGDEQADLAPADTPAMAWEDDVDLDANGAPMQEAAAEDIPEATPIDAPQEAASEEKPAPMAAGFAADDQVMDEDALRELVSEIVRTELQGALGERITRNVRKLVRREIHRALTAQELE